MQYHCNTCDYGAHCHDGAAVDSAQILETGTQRRENADLLHLPPHRGKDEIRHIDDAYHIPSDMVGIGKGQKYHIKTYGCQANERDSETLAGILSALKYEKTERWYYLIWEI